MKKIIIANAYSDDDDMINLDVKEFDSVESLAEYIQDNAFVDCDDCDEYVDEEGNVDWIKVATDVWNGEDVHYEYYEGSWAFKVL